MDWPSFDADHVLVSSEQMLALEREILSNGLPVASLMEKVGLSMAHWLKKKPLLLEQVVLVLIGPGNNGGDGLVVARELYLSGVDVAIWCPLTIKKQLPAQLLKNVQWLGIKQLHEQPEAKDSSFWIDALFGLGQDRPLPSSISRLFQERNNSHPGRLVSLDVPSGLCSNLGVSFPGGAAKASHTLTVGLIKQGLLQDSAL